jgi:cytochrome P450 family 710 subfamily A protein
MCIGREYAMNHLTAFVSLFAQRVDVRRILTPTSEDIVFLPTLFPADFCITQMRARGSAAEWCDEKQVEVLVLEGDA